MEEREAERGLKPALKRSAEKLEQSIAEMDWTIGKVEAFGMGMREMGVETAEKAIQKSANR